MHASRQRILEILREHGPTTVEELGRHLSLTTVTVRHHLELLRSEGLVSDPTPCHSSRPGRPQYTYVLTEQAGRLFPNNYALLAAHAISELKARSSPQEVTAFFEGLGSRLLANAPRPLPGEPLESRLGRAVEYLNAQGYFARWERLPEGYSLQTCNCPYRGVAGAHPEVCNMDLSLAASLLGCVLERRSRIADGQESCAYWVRDIAR